MHPNIGKALLGGFAGTLAMTIMMYVAAPMMGLNMDIAAMLDGMLGIGWAGGMLMHFMNGVVIPSTLSRRLLQVAGKCPVCGRSQSGWSGTWVHPSGVSRTVHESGTCITAPQAVAAHA